MKPRRLAPASCREGSCDACRQTLARVRLALLELESGRTGVAAGELRHILRRAGVMAEPSPDARTGPARPGDVRPAPEPAA